MNTRTSIIRLPIVGLLLALLVAGCAGSPPVNLYTLSAVGLPSTDIRVPPSTPAIVAVGPVILPDYIDRPQIVTRKSVYQLELAAYDQWAAPVVRYAAARARRGRWIATAIRPCRRVPTNRRCRLRLPHRRRRQRRRRRRDRRGAP